MHTRLAAALNLALVFGLLCSIAPLLVAAQAPSPTLSLVPQPLAFEVVSVKEHTGAIEFTGAMDSPDSMHAVGKLRDLIVSAYNSRFDFVVCKLPWCDTTLFDIRAKVSDTDQPQFEKLPYEAKAAMLQAVLAQRFGVLLHPETRLARVFDLVAAKNGPKLKQPPPNRSGKAEGGRLADGTIAIRFGQDGTTLQGYAVDLPGFASALTGMAQAELGRPILDRTGLTGSYDLKLTWSPPSHSALSDAASPAQPVGDSLFAAVQDQLGLTLKPAKEPQPFLIVDAAHTPTPD